MKRLSDQPFFIGVTRAKNQLNVFTTNKPSKFCSELLGKRNLRENRQKEYAGIKKWGDYSPAETYGVKENGMYHGSQKQPGKSYQELAGALGEGMIVKHKKFGEGGEITNVGKDGITVKCKDKSIVITKLKPSGKKEMKAIDFINGYKKELLGEFFK